MKVHTRAKREKRKGSHIRMGNKILVKKVRPKTFDSIEKANAWAKAKKLDKYILVNLRNEESSKKKIKVVY